MTIAQVYCNRAQHRLLVPDKQHELFANAQYQWSRCIGFCLVACADAYSAVCRAPMPNDKRFASEAWQSWLARHSSAEVAPPPMGRPATGDSVWEDAPGRYVLER